MAASLPTPQRPPFSASTRADRLQRLAEHEFDVLVVGGGITGTGIARDAAMRGLRTVLVEKGDLASGTSSQSSKLVHGGLRYLEQAELRLVFESVSERHRLRQLAPHLVRPLPFVFPVYGGRPRPLWMVATGLWIYDALALFRSYRLHRTYRRRAAAELEPALRPEGLDGALLYYDCLTDDARLTLETARSAHDAGAWVLNYSQLVSFSTERTVVTGARIRDAITGEEHSVRAKVVVNATGPWTDRTLGLRGDRARLLRPTKGVHLVVPHDRLPLQRAVVMNSPEDKRVVFAIPWGNRTVIGTTDTDFKGDFDRVHCDLTDARYLIGLANRFFPGRDLHIDDVVGTWAGLRPLVAGEGGPSEVSREHIVTEDPDGLVTVAGGKLTTYRTMAAEVVEVVARRLRRQGMHVGGCPTGSVLLPGGEGIAFRDGRLATEGPDGTEAEAELRQRVGDEVAEHLLETYGGRWVDVARRFAEEPSLAEPIVPGQPYLWAEVDYSVDEELALTVHDVLRRRIPLELKDCDGALAVAPRVADRMGSKLGWDSFRVAQEADRFRQEASLSMAWRAQ